MGDFAKLELSTETLRELSGAELEHVAGGAAQPPTLQGCMTGVYPTFQKCLTGTTGASFMC